MGNEGFFRRWARLKTETGSQEGDAGEEGAPAGASLAPAPMPGQVAAPQPAVSAPARVPTLEDAASLTAESNYADFVGKGVDKAVQRMAMKKLFTDPHFNVMDGLDIYISDYNKASPVPPVMLASLKQAQSFLSPARNAAQQGEARGEPSPDTIREQDALAQPQAVSDKAANVAGAERPAPPPHDGHDADPDADADAAPRSAAEGAASAPTQNPAGTGTAAPAPIQGN